MTRFSSVFLALLILILGAACAQGQIRPGQVPDVGIFVMSGAMPNDMVSFAYSGEVPQAQARADLKNIARLTGWQISDVNITTEPAEPGGPPMTTADFQVNNHAVQWATGILQVEPFAVAFKRFTNIRLTYWLQGTLPFRSLRDYSNRYVDIKLDDERGTYVYDITVKDHNFEKLGLPQIVAQPKPGEESRNSGTGGGSSGKIIWIALIIALAAGAVVYVLSVRASRSTKGADGTTNGTKGAV